MGKYTEYRPFDGKAGQAYRLSEHVSILNQDARLILAAFNKHGQAWAHTEHSKNLEVIRVYCKAHEIEYTVTHKHEGRHTPYFLINKVAVPDEQ